MVDDIEADEEGIVDVVLDDNAIRALPRPGTSVRTAIPIKQGQQSYSNPSIRFLECLLRLHFMV